VTATLLDGKATLAAIKSELRGRVQALAARGVVPGLGTVLVGEDPASLRALGSGKLLIQGSLSFKRAQLDDNHSGSLQVETEISIKTADIAAAAAPDSAPATVAPLIPRALARVMHADGVPMPGSGAESPKHEAAALRLQKVYKSFRTRRQLADAAVLVEQSWWKLLDFALLKRSSVSFFDIEKQETAVSKWSRARARAAKVKKKTDFASEFGFFSQANLVRYLI
jgi:hypothetical protein